MIRCVVLVSPSSIEDGDKHYHNRLESTHTSPRIHMNQY